jgi:hypothetical protein
MDHSALVEDAVTNVLANHEILMSNPGSAKLNSFYPSPAESSSTIAQAVDNSGQLIIQANSKQIGGASDFLVSTPNILDCPQLNIEFTVKAIPDAINVVGGGGQNIDQRKRIYMCTYHDGWGFDCIDRIEMTVAKSNISNLQLQGHALRDWSLLQCKNADERKQMLRIAGQGKTWTVDKEMKMQASVPLSFLFFRSAGGVKGGFGIDGRALHGPITFQIYFKPIQYFCGPAASLYNRDATPSLYDDASLALSNRPAIFPASIKPVSLLPTEFSKLEFTARTYQLMDGVFSVAKALDANPSLTYSLPSLWLNTYSQEVVLSSEGVGELNINSIPAGMLQAIIVRIRPVNVTNYSSYRLDTAALLTGDATKTNDYQSRLNYNPPNYNNVTRPVAGAVSNGEQTGVTAAYRPYVPWSLDVDELRLEYSGQAIYSARTKASHDNFIRSVFCDDLKTDVCGLPLTQTVVGQKSFTTTIYDETLTAGTAAGVAENQSTVTMLENLGDRAMVDHNTQVLVIPLCHDGDGVFRKRDFENLPHYSGSTLQLRFKVKPYNTYSTSGLDRQLCYDDGAQLGYDPDYLEDQLNKDGFADISRWKPELDSSKCASLPSNRLQHVAAAVGPNDREVIIDNISPVPAVGGYVTSTAPEEERERVIFNNNPTEEGATAFGSPNGGGIAGGTVQLDLTYVIASLFQVTNGTSELQL